MTNPPPPPPQDTGTEATTGPAPTQPSGHPFGPGSEQPSDHSQPFGHGTPSGPPPQSQQPFAPPQQPPQQPTGVSVWDQIHRLGVRRDRSTGWAGGVCSGVAQRLGVDPLLIRALAIVLAIAGGFGLVLYVLAWLLLPDTTGKILLREVARGDVTGIVLLVVLAILLFSGVSFGEGTWLGGWFVPVGALVIILLVVNHRKNDGNRAAPPVDPTPTTEGSPMSAPSQTTYPQSPAIYPQTPTPPWAGASAPSPGQTGDAAYATYAAPTAYTPHLPTGVPGVPSAGGADAHTPPPVPPVPPAPVSYGPPRPQRRRAPRGSGAIILGLAVLGYGAGFLLDGPTGFNGSGHFLGLLIALGVTSIAALVLGLSGRRGGMASVLSILLLLPVGVSALIEKAPLGPGEGQVVSWAPTADGGYNIGAGDATLDLSQLVTAGSAAGASAPSASAAAATPAPSDSATAGDPAGTTAPTLAPERATIRASVGAGTLTVLVPQGVEVTVRSNVGLGTLDFGPFRDDAVGRSDAVGVSQTRTIVTTGTSANPTPIDLFVSVGLGDLIFKEK